MVEQSARSILLALLTLLMVESATAWLMPRGQTSFTPIVMRSDRRGCTPKMCICINCARVTNCAAYHFVETKHGQPHMNEAPTFEPQNGSPTINVNIRSVENEARRQEINRMFNEHEAETERAMAKKKLPR